MAQLLCDFSSAASVRPWSAIDDRVMGGVSRSRLRHDAAGHAVFEGEVSLENNGGFASVRCAPQALGLAGAVDCLIEARGDGHRYKLSLLCEDRVDAPSYQQGFTPATAQWTLIRLPLSSFRPSWRGRPVPQAPALDPAHIRQLGLLIADGQAAAFSLSIRIIALA